jgi:biotin operon repressor
MNKLYSQLAEYLLKYAHGLENATPSRTIERKFGITARDARKIVNALRMSGVPICSGQTGYYFAKTEQEAKETAAVLNAMANSLIQAADGMVKFIKED